MSSGSMTETTGPALREGDVVVVFTATATTQSTGIQGFRRQGPVPALWPL